MSRSFQFTPACVAVPRLVRDVSRERTDGAAALREAVGLADALEVSA